MLYVGDVPYKPKIQTPTRAEILKLTTEDLQTIREVQAAKTEERTEKGSRFKAYACTVTNLSEVNTAYMHFKVKHSEATHVIMAYRLAEINPLDGEGWADDGEHKAGAKLLNLL